MFRFTAKARSDFAERAQAENDLLELDVKVVDALFAPMQKEIECDGFDGRYGFMSWKDELDDYRTDSFLDDILRLSEYYSDKNPALSAGLWGIWNAASYRRNKASGKRLFLSKSAGGLFIDYRALVATAAIQFADGNASTSITSNALSDIEGCRIKVESALLELEKYLHPER